MKGLRPLNLTRKAMKMSPKRPITKLIVTLSMTSVQWGLRTDTNQKIEEMSRFKIRFDFRSLSNGMC